jgi:hypothetical protein
MWQALISNSNLRTGIFRSAPDAERWLEEAVEDA